MGTQQVEVVIIGGGQAGLALSYYLTEQGRAHLVLEQDRIAESWRSKRWDSLRLIGPNWTLRAAGIPLRGRRSRRLHGQGRGGRPPGGLRPLVRRPGARRGAGDRDRARPDWYRLPGADRGRDVHGSPGRAGHRSAAATAIPACAGGPARPRGAGRALRLPQPAVAATRGGAGGRQRPGGLPDRGGVAARGADGLPVGRPQLVGAAPLPRPGHRRSGCALWAGSTAPSTSLPPGARTGMPNPQFTGSDGGRDLNVHTLAAEGRGAAGPPAGYPGREQSSSPRTWPRTWHGATSRRRSSAAGDRRPHPRAGTGRARGGPGRTDLRPASGAAHEGRRRNWIWRTRGSAPSIWATGYRPDLGWVRLPILDADGYPIQRRGVTAVPGLYILGLDWLHTAKSGLFAGVGEDAAYLAAQIAERATAALRPAAESCFSAQWDDPNAAKCVSEMNVARDLPNPAAHEGELMSTCSYELYALKYAESMAPHGTRFYGNDPHDGPTPMDFFVWAAVSPERTVVIDCGFTAETAARRGRRLPPHPSRGVAAARVSRARRSGTSF